MYTPLCVTGGVTLCALAFYHWLYHIVEPAQMSGDKWYMRQFAFGRTSISAPYCWRPLLPILARHLGFKLVSYSAILATPIVVYVYAGSGWAGCAVALMFVGNRWIFAFNVRNPEYAEGVGQFLMISTLFAMSVGSPLAWPLMLLCGLCRETIGVTLILIALFTNPFLVLPAAVGLAAAYLTRDEDKDNQHPLIEATPYETLVRWMRVKGANAVHYAHTVQTLRGGPFTVPFVWHQVTAWDRIGLIGFLPIWLLGLPASAQSRIFCYGFGLLIPFVAAVPGPWLWFLVILQWFWPVDYNLYDEGGSKDFAYAR